MARPPEPLEELIAEVSLAIAGRVTAVLGPVEGRPARPNEAAAQRVTIAVERVLFDPDQRAAVGASLTAIKPPGAYALAEGNHGPFLLAAGDDELEILGRYGPDTYPLASILAALG